MPSAPIKGGNAWLHFFTDHLPSRFQPGPVELAQALVAAALQRSEQPPPPPLTDELALRIERSSNFDKIEDEEIVHMFAQDPTASFIRFFDWAIAVSVPEIDGYFENKSKRSPEVIDALIRGLFFTCKITEERSHQCEKIRPFATQLIALQENRERQPADFFNCFLHILFHSMENPSFPLELKRYEFSIRWVAESLRGLVLAREADAP